MSTTNITCLPPVSLDVDKDLPILQAAVIIGASCDLNAIVGDGGARAMVARGAAHSAEPTGLVKPDLEIKKVLLPCDK